MKVITRQGKLYVCLNKSIDLLQAALLLLLVKHKPKLAQYDVSKQTHFRASTGII